MSTTESKNEVVAQVKAEVTELKWQDELHFQNLDSDSIWYMVGLAKLTKQVQKVTVYGRPFSKFEEERGEGKAGELNIHVSFENRRAMEQLKEMGVEVDVSQIEEMYKTARVERDKEVAALQVEKNKKNQEKRAANWTTQKMVLLADPCWGFSKGFKISTTKQQWIEKGIEPDYATYTETYQGKELEVRVSVNFNGRYEVHLATPWITVNNYGRRGYRSHISSYNETHRFKRVEKAAEAVREAIASGKRIIDDQVSSEKTRVSLQAKFEQLLNVKLIPDAKNEYVFKVQFLKNAKDEYKGRKSLTINVSEEKGYIQIQGIEGKFTVAAVQTMMDLLRNAEY